MALSLLVAVSLPSSSVLAAMGPKPAAPRDEPDDFEREASATSDDASDDPAGRSAEPEPVSDDGSEAQRASAPDAVSSDPVEEPSADPEDSPTPEAGEDPSSAAHPDSAAGEPSFDEADLDEIEDSDVSSEPSDPGGFGKDDITSLELEDLLKRRFTSIYHTHFKGEWMVGYQYMFMWMQGMRDGFARIPQSEVLDDFMVTPVSMSEQMHMLSLMNAPTDRLTWMVMMPIRDLSMLHVNRMGMRFRTDAVGIGDLSASVQYLVLDTFIHDLILTGGLTFPTGSIRRTDRMPDGTMVRLPYPMQLGSGTVDFLAGIQYAGYWRWLAWEVGTYSKVRMGENALEYRRGASIRPFGTLSAEAAPWIGFYARADAPIWGAIEGADAALNPMMVPTADPALQAGRRLDVAGGMSLVVPHGALSGLRGTFQAAGPALQHLDGPQLEMDWMLTASVDWTWSFQ